MPSACIIRLCCLIFRDVASVRDTHHDVEYDRDVLERAITCNPVCVQCKSGQNFVIVRDMDWVQFGKMSTVETVSMTVQGLTNVFYPGGASFAHSLGVWAANKAVDLTTSYLFEKLLYYMQMANTCNDLTFISNSPLRRDQAALLQSTGYGIWGRSDADKGQEYTANGTEIVKVGTALHSFQLERVQETRSPFVDIESWHKSMDFYLDEFYNDKYYKDEEQYQAWAFAKKQVRSLADWLGLDRNGFIELPKNLKAVLQDSHVFCEGNFDDAYIVGNLDAVSGKVGTFFDGYSPEDKAEWWYTMCAMIDYEHHVMLNDSKSFVPW